MRHAARRALSTLAVVLVAVAGACAEKQPPVAPSSPARSKRSEWENPISGERALAAFASPEGARCALAGRTVLDAELHLGAIEYEVIADVSKLEVGVQVLALAPRGSLRSKVRVRSVPSGPAVVVEGWVENRALQLRLLRTAEALPGYVWFESGAVVRALAGNGTRVRVGGKNRCQEDYGIAVDVDCSALAMKEPVPDPPVRSEPKRRVESYEPKRLPVALLDHAGHRVFDLGFGFIGVADRSSPLNRVHIVQDGLNIRGWVETSTIEPEHDRSAHCDEPRDTLDCPETPLAPEDSSVCRERAWEDREAVREFPLRAEPKLDAPVVGFVERGAKIRVPRSGTRFVSVDPEPPSLAGKYEVSFWALASDVR
jgi:hypothetical protein